MGDIVVVGSSNVDFIMQVEQLPERGETVTGGTFMQTYGGKGANQAVAAARAGGAVSFVCGVGEDMFGQEMRSNFLAEGMDVSNVRTMPGVASGSALIMFDKRGENYLTVSSGANFELLPSHVTAARGTFEGASQVVLQMEVPIKTAEATLDLAAELGVPTLLNFAPARDRELAIDDRITTLVVNEGECELLSGMPVQNISQAEAAALALSLKGPKWVVVTLGSDGLLAVTPSGTLRLPAFSVVPVDTTAAGDTFCGALAVALAESRPAEEALRFASAAAAISVTRMGAQPSIPRRHEIAAFLQSAS